MIQDTIYVRISPESLKNDIIPKTFSGNTFGVYSNMPEVLSGGTGGQSTLTDMSIPILFTQSVDDIGFYSEFDGFILQKDVVTNFLVVPDENNIYTVKLFNTSEETKKFLKLSSYIVNWGDGSTDIFDSSTEYLTHSYPNIDTDYVIELTQKNPWGITKIQKTVKIPTTTVTITNPQGNVTFTPKGGSWAGIPVSYDFIFTGDSENNVESQISENYTSTPFTITGFTSSKLNELKLYGPTKFNPSVVVKKYGQDYGQINELTSTYTAYTVNDIQYYDYNDGTTLFFIESQGLTEDMIMAEPITKEEVLMGVVDSPEIQSGIFIERGKNSAFESLQRLGEVDNIGDLTSYGYGFFKINKT